MQKNNDEQAIKAALAGKWDEAVTCNQAILADDPKNIAALNRMAKAYAQLGKQELAVSTYEQVLSLDRFNAIAQKQVQSLKANPCAANSNTTSILAEFIEEPGKTKTTSLVRLGDSKVLGSLQPGQLVFMTIKSHWITIITQNNEYIGSVADNISFKIKQLLAGGNQYQAVIRAASQTEVSVFIKELKRAPAYANTPSF